MCRMLCLVISHCRSDLWILSIQWYSKVVKFTSEWHYRSHLLESLLVVHIFRWLGCYGVELVCTGLRCGLLMFSIVEFFTLQLIWLVMTLFRDSWQDVFASASLCGDNEFPDRPAEYECSFHCLWNGHLTLIIMQIPL